MSEIATSASFPGHRALRFSLHRGQQAPQQRVHPAGVAIQEGDPPQAREAVREGLRAREILEPQKGVVLLGVPEAVAQHAAVAQELKPILTDAGRKKYRHSCSSRMRSPAGTVTFEMAGDQ